MKRILCLIFTALTLLSLTIPIGAAVPDYKDLPPLDMDNTTIEYDFENVFFGDYSIGDYVPNPNRKGVEFITMAEKGYDYKSKNLFNSDIYGTNIDSNSNPYIDISIFDVGDVITISLDVKSIIKFANSSGGSSVQQFSSNVVTVTITDKIKNCGRLFIISMSSYTPYSKNELLSYHLQIERGNTATSYEPYSYYGLYFYLYNPLRLKIIKDSASNLIQFGSNVTGGIKKDPRFKQHELKLVDTWNATDEEGDTTDAILLKFTLSDYDNFIYDESFDTRFYDVSGIELLLEGESTSKEYIVSKCFEFYNSNLGLPTCRIEETNVIRLDKLAFSYYRVESEIKNHYKDIQSVSFSIPNDFINKYGELTQLHAVWEECLTQPVLIANDANVVNAFKDVLNREAPNDFKYSFGYDFQEDYSNYTIYGQYNNYFNPSFEEGNTYYIGLNKYGIAQYLREPFYNNLIEKLYFVEYSKDVFDPNAVCVTSEKMEQNLDNYLWSDECFVEIDDTNFDKENPKLFDVTYIDKLDTYRVPTFWEKYLSNAGYLVNADNPITYSSIETIDQSYITTKNNNDLFAERYKVYKDDVDDIKAVSNDKSTTYIVRYTVTDYIVNQAFIYEDGSDEPVCDAIVGQAEAIRNFDFIDMYFTKDGVVTCFAVGMDKQNFVSDFTGGDYSPPPDRWADFLKFLEKCLVIAVVFAIISIVLKLFSLFNKTQVKVVLNERKRR